MEQKYSIKLVVSLPFEANPITEEIELPGGLDTIVALLAKYDPAMIANISVTANVSLSTN